jgi:secreted trypsin-like serine protease
LTIPQTSDVGLVILDEPVTDLGFGQLPEVGLADELNTAPGSEAMVNTVGYGLQAVKPVEVSEKIRYQATPMLVEVNSQEWGDWNIHVSSNPGEGGGTGGSCYGDSGGPAFWVDPETGDETLVGITSWGDVPCVSTGFNYRVDIAETLDFIEDVIAGLNGD